MRRSLSIFVWLVLLSAGLLLSVRVDAADNAPGAELFKTKIDPLLRKHCYSCHSHQAKKSSGGLVVDSRGALIAGGDTGPAVVPGKPAESLLLNAIERDENFVQMPPKTALSADEVALVKRWIELGAPWPGDTGKVTRVIEKISDEDRQWWAFQPVKAHQPPAVDDPAVRNDIDRFVRAKLKSVGLTPAPEAAPAALVRRLYFDVLGLPPTPEELAEFVAARPSALPTSPTAKESAWNDAYEALVDRLLASPRYGERMARLWLDLVRYADSDGYRIDDYRPQAWRYRDYVINAFNSDKPYDRFVQEQLAGDEMFPDNPEALIATGYLRHWIYEYNSRDVRGQWSIILNDITDTTGDVFLGLGLQCARCHDHKFDPILQKDYFRLQAFFAGIWPRDDLPAATAREQAEHAAAVQAFDAQTAGLRAELAALEEPYRKRAAEGAIGKFPEDIQAMIRKPVAERSPLEHQLAELAYRQVYYEYDRLDRSFKGDAKEQILALRKKLAEAERNRPAALPLAMATTDVGPQAAEVTIPKKGNTPIAPGYLTLLDERDAVIETAASNANSTGRRSALARWLTNPTNPLTARVMANRVWQMHFGRGLAANPSDFGKLGEPPTHPELLDWLAARLVADGWSLKKLHRSILLSATYRQSAEHPAAQAAKLKDPENRLLWRGSVRRLEAEQIRDALYAVTGELDLQAGGPGVPGVEPRRSIYNKIMRNTRDPLLDVFDAPFWFNSASSRDTTTTPVQSLLLINSQLMLQRAAAFAKRVARDEPSSPARRIERAYRLAFGRAPTADELQGAEKFLREQARRIEPEEAGSAQAAFLYGKIPYRDGQAAVCDPEGPQRGFQVTHNDLMPNGDFTIEAFALPRSIYDTGQVRALAAKWNGSTEQGGWQFGITGKGSRRKPQTLVLQMYGRRLDGSFGEQAIFSDQHIQLDKPYYLAAAVKLAREGASGSVSFYVKDLSNDDEPLMIAKVPHEMAGEINNRLPLALGSQSSGKTGYFDGLLDNVRLSSGALDVDELLFTDESASTNTVGYWQFEPRPDVFGDSSGHNINILPGRSTDEKHVNVEQAAWIDFCHVLLNSSEFLYVE